MRDVSLPSGSGVLRAPRGPGSRGGRGFKPQGGSRGRQGPRLVAHDKEDNSKARTEDVVTSESREKTFKDPLLSAPSQHKQNTIKQTALPYTQVILASDWSIRVTWPDPCSLIGQVLVFCNYTSIAQATADLLNSRGFPAVYMSTVQDQAR